ncbi:SDR family oxidoreductase [Candidatus Roizmanbacteria bacterium]|nr:SDR family oxidoreductase [Candidatus Roizmanbacteria bacterium]
MKNRFAVVTGSSTGIGQAIALELAKQGVFIALAGRAQDKLLKTKSLITSQGGQSEVFLGDFTKLDSLNALIALVKQRTEEVDILVNVAGIWHGPDEVYAGKDF